MSFESQEIKIRWRCPAGAENLGVYIRGVLSPVSLSCPADTKCQLKIRRQIPVGPSPFNLFNFRVSGYCSAANQEIDQIIEVNPSSGQVKGLKP